MQVGEVANPGVWPPGRVTSGFIVFQKKKKRTGARKASKEKELASSLMVACLKRLLPVGLNLFAGREQEIVQHCKEKFLGVSVWVTVSCS